MTAFEKRILHYMAAGFPILYLNTFEEGKAREAILHTSAKTAGHALILEWDGTDRVLDIQTGELAYEMSMTTLPEILDDRMDYKKRLIFILRNIDTFMEDPAVMARLNKMAGLIHNGSLDAVIIIISPVLRIPKEIEKYVTVIEMEYLTVDEIREVIRNFAAEYETPISERLEKELGNALKGLSEFEIENILQLALAESSEFTRSQMGLIFDQKQQIIKKAGILEMIPLREGLEDIGGLENLKDWLRRKAKVLSDIESAKVFGVDMPKGVLIAGVPGCGKSLSAKAAAKLFEIPLLRLDMGRLLGKYVGESEANMRRAIELAEAISPCVLWIDELEKAFAGIGGDGAGAEVTTRLFGSFLTWLQEKETPVFVVATANNITKLPPELLRKGRFDEVFYVGLPQREERRKILEIHIRKRRPKDFDGLDMERLLEHTEGFSGADIEGAIRESIETAFAAGRSGLSTAEILQAIDNTHSLSEIMKEPIEKMKKEYETRKFKNASR